MEATQFWVLFGGCCHGTVGGLCYWFVPTATRRAVTCMPGSGTVSPDGQTELGKSVGGAGLALDCGTLPKAVICVRRVLGDLANLASGFAPTEVCPGRGRGFRMCLPPFMIPASTRLSRIGPLESEMKFAVQLTGQANILESVAPAFQSEKVKIVKRENDWFLESSEFDGCESGGDVFPIADKILRLIHSVTHLHAHLVSPFEIGYVQAFNNDGRPLRRALRAADTISVYTIAGIRSLHSSTDSQTMGALIVAQGLADERIETALSLIGARHLGWPQIYDVIEFLGASNVVDRGWTTLAEVSRVRRTANHYRHLGRPQEYSIPRNPPSLGDSRNLVLGLMKKWVADQTQPGQLRTRC